MKKTVNKIILDEYVVKFWHTDTDGFAKQEKHVCWKKEFMKEMKNTHK